MEKTQNVGDPYLVKDIEGYKIMQKTARSAIDDNAFISSTGYMWYIGGEEVVDENPSDELVIQMKLEGKYDG
jgi:hypothetical protein